MKLIKSGETCTAATAIATASAPAPAPGFTPELDLASAINIGAILVFPKPLAFSPCY